MTPGKINASESASTMDIPIIEQSDRDEPPPMHAEPNLAELKKPMVAFIGGDASNIIDRNDSKSKQADKMEEELLGSLTSMSSPAVRTSARVIQKMKMDSIRPTTPPPSDKRDAAKDEHHRNAPKTPNQSRPSKTTWTMTERTLFFDALNEFGKEFEAIANYINGKQKRKTSTDPSYKTKEHVRLLYYQTFTKISKYLRFSDDVTKKVQELYALTNYGEMRKKLGVDNQKFYMKLRELVYRGSVTLRVKGKNWRIKTPSCPALRKINQVEKWQEDIKLPSKVEVELKPADNESWYSVQSLAQNPRVKTSLPLQKRLISLLKTLHLKWRSRESKMWDQQVFATKTNSTTISATAQLHQPVNSLENGTHETVPTQLHNTPTPYIEPILCITPPMDATIHRPYVTLTDFLNSNSICLNSYEERIEATVRGETLCAEHITNVREAIKSNTKRQRHDSGSEKKSPDTKRTKVLENHFDAVDGIQKTHVSTSQDGMSTISNDDLIPSSVEDRGFSSPTYENAMFDMDVVNHQMPEILSADECERLDDIVHTPNDGKKDGGDPIKMPTMGSKTSRKTDHKSHVGMNSRKRAELRPTNRENYRPLINEDVLQKIRKGWHIYNIGDLTIGDLYIMFGSDSKLRLEYKWQMPISQMDVKTEPGKVPQKHDHDVKEASEEVEVRAESAMNNVAIASTSDGDCVEAKPVVADIKPSSTLSNKLKQLLLLAGMMEKTKRKQSCACGHYCDRGVNKIKKEDPLVRSFVSNKIYQSNMTDNTLFRTPHLPNRTARAAQHYESYRVNMNAPRSKQNRWQKSRNIRTPKQVVVQRLLPLQPGIAQPFVLSTPDVNYSNANITNASSSALPGTSTQTIESNSTLTAENLNRLNILAEHSPVRSLEHSPARSIEHTPVRPLHPPTDISKLLDEDSDDECDKEIENCDMADEFGALPNLDSDDEENRRLRQRFDEDPGIRCLMDISLPSPLPMPSTSHEYFEDNNSHPSINPIGILRESPVPSATKWFEENMNDFSLSSFLGHLEANCDGRRSRSRSPNRLIDGTNMSTISDTSIDYMSRFEELAAESMKNDANNPIPRVENQMTKGRMDEVYCDQLKF